MCLLMVATELGGMTPSTEDLNTSAGAFNLG